MGQEATEGSEVKRKPTVLINPVAKAVAKQGMRKHLSDIAIRAYMTEDGQSDRELLSMLAFVIGLGAEVALALPEKLDTAKQMHAALRDLVSMSVDGGRWRANQATRLHDLALQACALAIDYVDIAMPRYGGAVYLADRIKIGVAAMSDVAGAEIYQDQAKPHPP